MDLSGLGSDRERLLVNIKRQPTSFLMRGHGTEFRAGIQRMVQGRNYLERGSKAFPNPARSSPRTWFGLYPGAGTLPVDWAPQPGNQPRHRSGSARAGRKRGS
jgi:hypothetical protein